MSRAQAISYAKQAPSVKSEECLICANIEEEARQTSSWYQECPCEWGWTDNKQEKMDKFISVTWVVKKIRHGHVLESAPE